ncbi:MAG TPA: hypothetical protein DDX92_04050 [Flavobacteriales bacterium]|jgi:hypothetical protein|nr:hypothetical protein [Flavobacteriales bacterium]
MNPLLRNILGVIAGIIVGSFVNMSIIMTSGSIIPPPEGADMTTTEGIIQAMPLLTPKHFIMPFLAHALGTLVGALVTGLIAVGHKMKLAFAIGFFFLAGGIANVFMLPAPMWFNVVDLVFAYLPMAWIGGKLSLKRNVV